MIEEKEVIYKDLIDHAVKLVDRQTINNCIDHVLKLYKLIKDKK